MWLGRVEVVDRTAKPPLQGARRLVLHPVELISGEGRSILDSGTLARDRPAAFWTRREGHRRISVRPCLSTSPQVAARYWRAIARAANGSFEHHVGRVTEQPSRPRALGPAGGTPETAGAAWGRARAPERAQNPRAPSAPAAPASRNGSGPQRQALGGTPHCTLVKQPYSAEPTQRKYVLALRQTGPAPCTVQRAVAPGRPVGDHTVRRVVPFFHVSDLRRGCSGARGLEGRSPRSTRSFALFYRVTKSSYRPRGTDRVR
jgi:hypothetical protein